jgi:hypothetical protein
MIQAQQARSMMLTAVAARAVAHDAQVELTRLQRALTILEGAESTAQTDVRFAHYFKRVWLPAVKAGDVPPLPYWMNSFGVAS